MPEIPSGQDLDLSLLYEIADGSSEFIVESIDMFLEQTPESLQQVAEALDIRDWPVAGSAAHKLKATLGFFGMLESQALIQQIELSCKSGSPDVDDVMSKFAQVKTNVAQNSSALLKLRADTEAGI